MIISRECSTTPNSKKMSTNKCITDRQPDSSVTIQTGYICDTMTSLQFRRQTFCQGEFAESVNKTDCKSVTSTTTGNSDMADEPRNIIILLDLQLIASKFQRQGRYFCPNKVSPSDYDNAMSDNRKWYYGR